MVKSLNMNSYPCRRRRGRRRRRRH